MSLSSAPLFSETWLSSASSPSLLIRLNARSDLKMLLSIFIGPAYDDDAGNASYKTPLFFFVPPSGSQHPSASFHHLQQIKWIVSGWFYRHILIRLKNWHTWKGPSIDDGCRRWRRSMVVEKCRMYLRMKRGKLPFLERGRESLFRFKNGGGWDFAWDWIENCQKERMTELQRGNESLLVVADRKRPHMRTDAIGSQRFFFYSKNNNFIKINSFFQSYVTIYIW